MGQVTSRSGVVIIASTRKTTPGMRALEKRAVKLGGKMFDKGREMYRDPTLAGMIAKEGGEIARELAQALVLSDGRRITRQSALARLLDPRGSAPKV